MVAFREYTRKGGKYVAYMKLNGKQVTKVVRTKGEGKAWERQVRVAARKQKVTTTPHPASMPQVEEAQPESMKFSQAVDEYLCDCDTRSRANTIQEKLSIYRKLAAFFGKDIPLGAVTPVIAKKYANHLQAVTGNNKTTNRHLRNIKTLWNFFIWDRRLDFNPWKAVRSFPEEEFERYIPSAEDVQAVLEIANQFEKDFLAILLQTGARVGEGRELKWSDVDFERGSIKFWTGKRKNGRRCRLLPMTESARQVLMRLNGVKGEDDLYVFINPNTGGLYDRNHHPIKYLTKNLCERAGVKKFTLYSLRHFFAHRVMEKEGVVLMEAQTLMGHQSPTTTDHYLRSYSLNLGRLKRFMESENGPENGG